MELTGLRAAVALPLTGRYRPMAEQARHGLETWAGRYGVELEVEDCGESPAAAASATRALATRAEVLFGPYGSGAMRAVADALAGHEIVCWNHGGAALVPRAWIVNVLAPAEWYWSGLPDVLAERGSAHRVAVLSGASEFGRQVGAGAAGTLRAAGIEPVVVATFDETSAADVAGNALAAGANIVIGSGRLEDDVALGHALLDNDDTVVGLVVCGSALAGDLFGDAVAGWIGPSQWVAGDDPESRALGPNADYPAAQAFAAGQLASEAIARAGTCDHRAVWDVVRRLRTATFFGPFAIDDAGRQTAHRPVIVEWGVADGARRRRVVWRPDSG